MNISDETRRILAPLEQYRSQGTLESTRIGGSYTWSSPELPQQPTVSHAEFVINHVLPCLEAVCAKFGQEVVAQDIVDLTHPVYGAERMLASPGDTANYRAWQIPGVFLSYVLMHHDDKDGNVSSVHTNVKLAERFGMRYVFDPIIELYCAHVLHNVFSRGSKFMHIHAVHMGEVIGNFSRQDYLDYIALAKRLLQHGVYDWAVVHSPEEWGMLSPSIRMYGLKAVLEPMIQAILDIRHLKGTLDIKYKYSLLPPTIRALYPIMLPKVRKKGPVAIDIMLRPIVNHILKMGESGKFQNYHAHWRSPEGDFFRHISDNVHIIHKVGIRHYLRHKSYRW